MIDLETAALLGLDDLLQRILRAPEVPKSPAEHRVELTRQIVVVDEPGPAEVTVRDDIAPGAAGGVPVRVYEPHGLARPSPGLVYFHGGGWVSGSVSTHDGLCRRLALGAACRVVSVEYRLAPEAPFPAGLEDALAAFRWTAEQASRIGIDPARLGVGGDSAGGNLASVVALRLRGEKLAPALQLLIYPAVDAIGDHPSRRSLARGYFLTSAMIDWFCDQYLKGVDRSHPEVSPLLAPNLSGAAPAWIYTAGLDPLRDEGAAYAERLRKAGVLVEYKELSSLVHGFAQMTRAVPAALRAVEAITSDLARALSRPA